METIPRGYRGLTTSLIGPRRSLSFDPLFSSMKFRSFDVTVELAVYIVRLLIIETVKRKVKPVLRKTTIIGDVDVDGCVT